MYGRKTIQGEMTILTHEFLRKPQEVKGELLNQQYVLAWCVELAMIYILIMDDIEDGAKTRNGKPCWHLLPDVGSLAGNDSSMLRSFIFELLNQNFSGEMFVNIIKLFNEAFFSCNVGQYMDAVTSKRKNYNNFTMKHYESIALYKYAYYSSVFPILSALILSNKYNVESRKNVMAIFNDIGVWSQINNDFTDYFDEDTKTGKTGTDIQEGKCTWLAVTVLERCSENQRKIFEESYGSWDPVKIKRIREIYEQTGVIDIYFREEQTTYDRVVEKIKSLPEDTVPSPEFFQTMLDKYYPNVICGKSFKSSN
ncbi:farnesyl pyrophosphate synthase-like isoform X3 [Battus philenor]